MLSVWNDKGWAAVVVRTGTLVSPVLLFQGCWGVFGGGTETAVRGALARYVECAGVVAWLGPALRLCSHGGHSVSLPPYHGAFLFDLCALESWWYCWWLGWWKLACWWPAWDRGDHGDGPGDHGDGVDHGHGHGDHGMAMVMVTDGQPGRDGSHRRDDVPGLRRDLAALLCQGFHR